MKKNMLILSIAALLFAPMYATGGKFADKATESTNKTQSARKWGLIGATCASGLMWVASCYVTCVASKKASDAQNRVLTLSDSLYNNSLNYDYITELGREADIATNKALGAFTVYSGLTAVMGWLAREVYRTFWKKS